MKRGQCSWREGESTFGNNNAELFGNSDCRTTWFRNSPNKTWHKLRSESESHITQLSCSLPQRILITLSRTRDTDKRNVTRDRQVHALVHTAKSPLLHHFFFGTKPRKSMCEVLSSRHLRDNYIRYIFYLSPISHKSVGAEEGSISTLDYHKSQVCKSCFSATFKIKRRPLGALQLIKFNFLTSGQEGRTCRDYGILEGSVVDVVQKQVQNLMSTPITEDEAGYFTCYISSVICCGYCLNQLFAKWILKIK